MTTAQICIYITKHAKTHIDTIVRKQKWINTAQATFILTVDQKYNNTNMNIFVDIHLYTCVIAKYELNNVLFLFDPHPSADGRPSLFSCMKETLCPSTPPTVLL